MKTALFLTAIGPRYEAMADAAAARWHALLPELGHCCIAGPKTARALGLPDLDPIRTACLLKLHAFDLIPADCDAVLYADLDILPITPMPPSAALAGVDFAGVRDRWDDPEVIRVAASVGLPPQLYANAGLFYARRSCAAMFQAASALFDIPKWYDQTALNLARHTHRIATAWLPWRHNAMDRHDDGYALACSHAPHHAWPFYEDGKLPDCRPLIGIDDLIQMLDFSHHYTTAANHLRDLAEMARGRRHCLDLGTFQGHSALAMASAGCLVTSIDPANTTRRVFDPISGLSYDAFRATAESWFDADPHTRYDMIFHDAQHGPEIIPELERCWQRLLPGGLLAIHDAEQLDAWSGQTLNPKPTMLTESFDDRGRMLMSLSKP